MILLIFIVIFIAMNMVTGFNATGFVLVGASFFLLLLFALLTILFSMLYFVLMDVKFGGTLGKKFLKLHVVATTGKLDLSKGIMRNLAILGGILIGAMLGSFIFLVGAIIGLLVIDVVLGLGATPDPRQKLTDKLAGTTVVRMDIQENLEELKYIPPKPESTPKAVSEYTLASTGHSDETKTTETETSATGTDSSMGEGEKLPEAQDEVVKKYSEFFEIDEVRALALYIAGYKRLEDFKDAIVDDLIMVEKINPTIARMIIKKIYSEPLKED